MSQFESVQAEADEIVPLGKYVLVEMSAAPRSQGGIQLSSDDAKQFTIVAVGDGVENLQKGDNVILAKWKLGESCSLPGHINHPKRDALYLVPEDAVIARYI